MVLEWCGWELDLVVKASDQYPSSTLLIIKIQHLLHTIQINSKIYVPKLYHFDDLNSLPSLVSVSKEIWFPVGKTLWKTNS